MSGVRTEELKKLAKKIEKQISQVPLFYDFDFDGTAAELSFRSQIEMSHLNIRICDDFALQNKIKQQIKRFSSIQCTCSITHQ